MLVGAAAVAGYTSSSNFPVSGAVQPLKSGGYDGFVAWLAPAGNALEKATYWGGSDSEAVYAVARDSAGNTKAFSATVKLDTTAPAGTIVINNGDAITADQVVTLTLTATDNNGVAYVMVSNQPDFLLGSWANYDKTMSWKLPEKLGPQTVYAKFKDTAGLVSPVVSDSIILDIHEEGFHGSILLNSGDAYSSNQTLNVTLDLIGGDAQTTVMLAEGQDFAGATWVPYASAMSIKVSNADGQATVYAKFKDRYGIVSPVVSDTIMIDTAAPTVTILTPKMNAKVDNGKVMLIEIVKMLTVMMRT
jgi:hypothetical protein